LFELHDAVQSDDHHRPAQTGLKCVTENVSTSQWPPSPPLTPLTAGLLDPPPLGSPPQAAPATPRWLSYYVASLVILDTTSFLLGGSLGYLIRFNSLFGDLVGFYYGDILLTTAPVWFVSLAAARGYEGRFLGVGSEEFRRVGNAAARFTALVAVTVYLFKWDVARGLVVVALPAATFFTLLFRYLARQVLHHLRQDGAASHRVLVVGDGPARDVLVQRLRSAPWSGLHVVGACRPLTADPHGSASIDHVRSLAQELGADTIAVAHSPQISPNALRRLAWSLEGGGLNLLLAPALTDVAGPRVNIRPVSGLPLLQVAEPEFAGAKRVAKHGIDLVASTLAIILGCPLFVAVAAAVRLSSRGPVLFRQVRIGRHGRHFVMYKFRSMYVDAEAQLAELRPLNDHGDGILFKMHDDPRITRVGRFLRRYSLDELPQLFNVMRGEMSLVGPRPPLPSEVARYERDVRRRLLVRPGLTGLWQVSGRSDLDWDETVRLDLYYVENWSVALDAEILWKTASAVLRGSGAR
jgi:exopolysaccharide biosynthesis polyprenyl glycosylphosphotransferase